VGLSANPRKRLEPAATTLGHYQHRQAGTGAGGGDGTDLDGAEIAVLEEIAEQPARCRRR